MCPKPGMTASLPRPTTAAQSAVAHSTDGLQAAYYRAIQDVLSVERFLSYRRPSEKERVPLAVLSGRYAWNVALGEALYPTLHLFEVVLRNRVYSAIDSVHRMRPRPGLLSWLDAGTRVLTPEHARRVAKAKADLIERLERRRRSPSLTVGKLVAELNFGFWVYLFDADYGFVNPSEPKLWPRLLDRVFPHLPSAEPRVRDRFHKRLMAVNALRNRAFHHEPLWRLEDLPTRYADMVTILSWMSEPAARTVRHLDRFPGLYRAGMARYFQRRIRSIASIDNG